MVNFIHINLEKISLFDFFIFLTQNRKAQFIIRKLCLSVTLAFSHKAMALPQSGTVVVGTGTISTDNNRLTINQNSQNLAIDWQSFNIGRNELVRFNQPSSSSVALNRVLDSNPTQIFGQLSANGQVFLLNPQGIIFSPTAQVNVGGLVASTLSLSNEDFEKGNFHFSGTNSNKQILNQGQLTTQDHGYIALLAPDVKNEGIITAKLGTALLASGDKVNLEIDKGALISYHIDQGTVNALIENKNLIQAEGGKVYLSAKAAQNAASAVVNNSGIIKAQRINNEGGVIRLMADMEESPTQTRPIDLGNGKIHLSGTLDASAADDISDGGFIETSAAHVQTNLNTHINTQASRYKKTGTWLIDPLDFTISPGNAVQTDSGIGAATLSDNLTRNNVILATNTSSSATGNGNIFINGSVYWNTNELTLSAYHNIYINADLFGSSTDTTQAKLNLEFGQGFTASNNTSSINLRSGVRVNLPEGNNYRTKQGFNGTPIQYTVITRLGDMGSTSTHDLQGINGNLAGNYVLGNDIDASSTATWNSGAGFASIGHPGGSNFYGFNSHIEGVEFTGRFDGLGHTISNLTINRPDTNYVGLFRKTSGSHIQNITLNNVSILGGMYTGALIGWNHGNVYNASSSGTVSGFADVGGLVGDTYDGIISHSSSSARVVSVASSLYEHRGGYSDNIGGLVGENYNTTIRYSYATGDVQGSYQRTGGLVGSNRAGMIENTYATGNVTGYWRVGGLIGSSENVGEGDFRTGKVENSYATGNVISDNFSGGLIGGSYHPVRNSYSSGSVSGDPQNYIGASFGYVASGVTENIYYNSTTSTQANAVGGFTSLARQANITGLTSEQMRHANNFTGFDISSAGATGQVWRIYEGYTQPLLRSFLTPLITENIITTYNGNTQQGISITSDASDPRHIVSAEGKNVGTYYNTAYSNQQGFDLSGGNLMITPAALTLTGSRTYDGTNSIYGEILTATGVNGETFNVSGTGTAQHKNVQTNQTLATLDSLSIGSSNNGGEIDNYLPLSIEHSSISITPRNLNVNIDNRFTNKVYDGTTNASVQLIDNRITDDNIVTTYENARFADKNVGLNKTVHINNIQLSGTDANNYILDNTQATTIADITPRPLNVSITANDKTYDATNTAQVQFNDDRIAGDVFNFNYLSATFNNKNAGNNKTVTANGISIHNNDANNYQLVNNVLTTTANITKKDLTVTASNVIRTENTPYTGNSEVIYNGFVGSENATHLQGTLVYSGNAIGQTSPGTYTIELSGLSSFNYTIRYVNGQLLIPTLAPTIPSGILPFPLSSINEGSKTLTTACLAQTQRDETESTLEIAEIEEYPVSAYYIVDAQRGIYAESLEFIARNKKYEDRLVCTFNYPIQRYDLEQEQQAKNYKKFLTLSRR
jgi:filamentous hemagglutinin family protein